RTSPLDAAGGRPRLAVSVVASSSAIRQVSPTDRQVSPLEHMETNVPNRQALEEEQRMSSHDLKMTELHGHRLAYRIAGEGPVVLLIHGMAGTNAIWEEIIPPLTDGYTVIAPDLPGHGQSGASAGDYSVGAMAATLRDLLLSLGHDRATVVGHSLGGGVAMQ